MTAISEIDFLSKPSPNRIKKEIQNICDSYNHPWDFVAELCQNSVDAINTHIRKFGSVVRNHEIDITIDARNRSFIIKDTGVGFEKDRFIELLAPHGTNKFFDSDTIGNKGVGLTYTIFTSNKYEIITRSIDGVIIGEIVNASAWKNSSDSTPPTFNYITSSDEPNDPHSTGTQITLSNIETLFDDEEDIFNQSPEVISLLLKSKTAIGYTKTIFEDSRELNISVTVRHINKSGVGVTLDIAPKFIIPEDFLAPSSVINIDDFKKSAAILSDEQKNKKLRGKCLVSKGSISRANRTIYYYSFFAPSRSLYKEISEKNKFINEYNGEDKDLQFSGGIYVSSKGMPTGIRLEPPKTGEMGYWPNFYILIEDDSINFDLGRKAVPSRTVGLLKEVAANRFAEFRPFIEYVRTDPPVKFTNSTIQQYEKSQRFAKIKNYANLSIDAISILKHPNGQEAAVVALFHELVGAKILKGYYTYEIGYKMTYDFWGLYKIDSSLIGTNYKGFGNGNTVEMDIVAEFKFKGEDILDDFDADVKFFNDIDLIVCWDFDESKLAKKNVTVELIANNDVLYFGTTHTFSWPGSYNLGAASEKPVICLRQFITDYKRHR